MGYAYNIPGYLQGHRFSDDDCFYDSANQRFKDLAGFDHLGNGLSINVGSPNFATVDGNRGLLLDNTFHGEFRHPVGWQGSAVFVVKPRFLTSGTQTSYPLLFGDSSTASNNGQLRLNHFSGARRFNWISGSGDSTPTLERTDDNLVVIAVAMDQQTRTAYATSDGVTVDSTPVTANNDHGSHAAMSSGIRGCRFGEIKGIAGDTTAEEDLQLYFFEQHYFAGNILLGSLDETAAFMASLKKKYGVSE